MSFIYHQRFSGNDYVKERQAAHFHSWAAANWFSLLKWTDYSTKFNSVSVSTLNLVYDKVMAGKGT